MIKIFINLNQTSGGEIPNGWTASVAIAKQSMGHPQNELAIGESIIYQTKHHAWESIRNRVEILDYETHEVFFNYLRVYNFFDIEENIQSLK
jgi:hypothetical protein